MANMISNNYLLDKIGKTPEKPVKKPVQNTARDFREVFDKVKSEKSDVKISKHAEMRLKSRNVTISQEKLGEVSKAMDRAGQKGIKDALIIVDGNALVASIKNRTIVTCARQDDLDSKIITNIDGAIVL